MTLTTEKKDRKIQEESLMASMLIEKIPEDVRKRFKAWCAINDTTMRDALISYMSGISDDIDIKKTKGVKRTIYNKKTTLQK